VGNHPGLTSLGPRNNSCTKLKPKLTMTFPVKKKKKNLEVRTQQGARVTGSKWKGLMATTSGFNTGGKQKKKTAIGEKKNTCPRSEMKGKD